MKKTIKETHTESGQLISRTTFHSEESNGNCIRETFHLGRLIEYCEFRQNLKSGLKKSYSDDGKVLLEESYWQDDHCIESKVFYPNRQLKKHLQFKDDDLVLEMTFDERGNPTRSVEKGKFPALLLKTYFQKSDQIETEHLQLTSDVTRTRFFYPSGALKIERVLKKIKGKNNSEIEITRSIDGEISQIGGVDADLLGFLSSPIPTGEWVLKKGKKEILMQGLATVGDLEVPRQAATLKQGWHREGFREVYFVDGKETLFYRNLDPKTLQIVGQFIQESDLLHYSDHSTQNWGPQEATRKISDTEWIGTSEFKTLTFSYSTEWVGYSRPPESVSPPIEWRRQGLSQTRDMNGQLTCEVRYHQGALDGICWRESYINGVLVRIEEELKMNLVVSRKVWENGQLTIDTSFKAD